MPKISTAVLLFIVVLSSCHTPRYIYSPAPPNTPFFTHKNQSVLAAYVSGGDGRRSGYDSLRTVKPRNQGFDLQGAYSISDHFAITADYFKRKERDVFNPGDINIPDDTYYNFFDSSVVNYNRNLFSLGVGYFKILDRKQSITFNVYAGIGFGKFSFTDKGSDKSGVAYQRQHSADITKWYIQPSIHFIEKNYFAMGLVTKFSIVNYRNVSSSYNSEERSYYSLDWLDVKKSIIFFEPGLTIQGGPAKQDWVKIQGIFCFSSNPFLFSPDQEYVSRQLRARSFSASIGLNFDLMRLMKKAPR
jgi:hypothetical protein